MVMASTSFCSRILRKSLFVWSCLAHFLPHTVGELLENVAVHIADMRDADGESCSPKAPRDEHRHVHSDR